MDRKELLRIIEQARRKGTTTLDLAGKRLSVLPPEIGQLTNLTTLFLHRNQLTALPPEIGQLTNLTRLHLDFNGLTALPADIGQLANLRRLYVGLNQLAALPPEIGQLTNLTRLDIDRNELTALPPEIGQLTNLTILCLNGNQLTALPPQTGQLASLTELDLGRNRLTTLPPEIGQLTKLTRLDLARNQLLALPPEIGQLNDLRRLELYRNQLTLLPREIGQLKKLEELQLWRNRLPALPREIGHLNNLRALLLHDNQLTALPPEIGQLTKLTRLDLHANQSTGLPPEIGRLTNLKELDLRGNPLSTPPSEVVEQGTAAILAYLRERLTAGRREWISKLLVVGEGGVGKSALLRSLRGEPFDPQLPSTHGIRIEPLELEHPTEDGVTMQLNCWDFGGQEIYHATHQFFLTNRSLFVLAWNSRHGYEQGKLRYWLDAIEALAPESPVLLVATHLDQRDADLPLAELMADYPQIVRQWKISNQTGQGIEALREGLTETAAGLPLMGETWPAAWLDAAEAVRARKEKHVTPAVFRRIMAEHNVTDQNADVLGRWMHELGDILYFQDDRELDDLVILKPQWVTEYISRVLESDDVIAGDGIFTRDDMDKLWHELGPAMRDHFLRLMERFDLSYRTLENREISLVVERLPLDPPDYQPKWDGPRQAEPCREMPCREISMRFRLNTIPAGIPTWFIARTHRFTTHTHWRNGAVFADGRQEKHVALARALQHDRCVELSVRGPSPHNFFALLKDGLEVTLRRFPGLKINRMIPCPGHDGGPCDHEFHYDHLQKAIERDPPIREIQCPVSFENVSVSELLFGLHWRVQDDVLNRLAELQRLVVEGDERILAEMQDLRALAQREFAIIYRREQSKIESHCPNVFVLRPRERSALMKAIVGRKLDLQLYCQAPGQWHPTRQGGRYKIDDPAGWIRATAPLLRGLVKVLEYTAPLAGPWMAVELPEYEKLIGDDLKLMNELVKKLPELEEDRDAVLARSMGEYDEPDRIGGAALRALRELLDEKDPDHHWGGLQKVLTPEGHYLWLCEHHAEEYAK